VSKRKFNSLGTPPKKAQKLAASVATDSDSALREGNRAPGKKHELVTAARAKQIRDFARSFKQLCDVYQLDVFASIDGDFIEIVERNVKYPNGYEYSGMMKGIYGGRLQGLYIERECEDDEADAASVSAGSEIPERGSPWTLDEIIELAKTAIDNGLDYVSVAPGTLPSFQEEFEFQLHAPEHSGRPLPTPAQLAVALAIWNADERTSGPKFPHAPEFKPKGDTA